MCPALEPYINQPSKPPESDPIPKPPDLIDPDPTQKLPVPDPMPELPEIKEYCDINYCTVICGMFTLICSAVLAYILCKTWFEAELLAKIDDYQCILELEPHKEDFSKVWINHIKAAFIGCVILSAIFITAMIGACLPIKRPVGIGCVCFAQIGALVYAIGLTVIKFGEKGVLCMN